MISLRKTSDAMETLEESVRAADECYTKTIRACSDCAVDFDAHALEEFREQLGLLEARTKGAATATEFRIACDSLRSQLEVYQSLGRERIGRIREDMKSAAAAMKVFADGVSNGSADYEVRLRQEVRRLENLAGSNDLPEIRSGIREATAAILESHQQLESSNRMVISQLRDEIRTLHQAIDVERQKRMTDRVSGAWNRQKITERLELLLSHDQPFCVLVVGISNWKRIQGRYSANALQAVVRAFLGSLQGLLGRDPVVGRWTDQLFLCVAEVDPSNAMSLSGELKKKMPTSYTVQDAGSVQAVKLETSIGVVDRRQGIDAARFYRKLEQLTEALAGS